MTLLVTGGLGFIGSNFVHHHHAKFPDELIVVLDKGTYASDLRNLDELSIDTTMSPAKILIHAGDIRNQELINCLLSYHHPRAIINFAAETHVDRSIDGPMPFVQTNIVGLTNLLNLSREYYGRERDFKFLQVSTDEVYGSLDEDVRSSKEGDPYTPRSPYSASKAAGDHLCQAYWHTYQLPIILTNCCNNYGPRQYREKFIPIAINRLLNNKPVPVYGDGTNIREWVYVDDHCAALEALLEKGVVGEQYHIGGTNELPNKDMVELLAAIVSPDDYWREWNCCKDYVEYVKDRPGHDFRYSLNDNKIKKAVGWKPTTQLVVGLRKTVEWYKNNVR